MNGLRASTAMFGNTAVMLMPGMVVRRHGPQIGLPGTYDVVAWDENGTLVPFNGIKPKRRPGQNVEIEHADAMDHCTVWVVNNVASFVIAEGLPSAICPTP